MESLIQSNIMVSNHRFWLILVKSAILVKELIDSTYYPDKESSIPANTSETCYSNEGIDRFHLLKSATQLRNRRFRLILVKPAILVKELINSLVRIADFDQPA